MNILVPLLRHVHDTPGRLPFGRTGLECVHVLKPLTKARRYATALGLYAAELNGEKLDDTYFAPGWTGYHKRLQYQTCCLNPAEGENELRFTLGNGWYKGLLGFNPTPNHYGDATALLVMVCLALRRLTGEFDYFLDADTLAIYTYYGSGKRKLLTQINCHSIVAFAPIAQAKPHPGRSIRAVAGSGQVWAMDVRHEGQIVRVLLQPNEIFRRKLAAYVK